MKIRVSTLLESETIKELEIEAAEKQISVSAVIRQRVVSFKPQKNTVYWKGVPTNELNAEDLKEYKDFVKNLKEYYK